MHFNRKLKKNSLIFFRWYFGVGGGLEKHVCLISFLKKINSINRLELLRSKSRVIGSEWGGEGLRQKTFYAIRSPPGSGVGGRK